MKSRNKGARLGRALLAHNVTLNPTHNRHAGLRTTDLVDAANVDEPATGNNAGPVTQLRGLIQVVGCEEDRRPLGLQRLDDTPKLSARLRVKTRSRLV